MLRGRVGSLSRALAKVSRGRCGWCGGRNGVGGAPLVVVCGEPAYGAYAASDGLCPMCGAGPSHTVEIIFPSLPGDAGDDGEE